ncbi:hypothetical protein [Parasutterella excrementihominis]|jgi:hypothetical protein|uniref:hypothetical protein n=1 Tax=Parasutterella excrementihominis TaxID=487175 RepID=UPI003AB711A7
MDRKEAHANIVNFLKNQTNLRGTIEERIVYKELENRGEDVTEATVKEYFMMHNAEINEKVTETIDVLVWEMLPEKPIVTVIKRFDLWSLLLVPPLYPLASYAAQLLFQEPRNWIDIGSVFVSIAILLSFLIASLIANLFFKH